MQENLFKQAQNAVLLPEVQAAMRLLAEHNLGVCVPHVHSASEPVRSLPSGMVQMESDLQISFVSDSEVEEGTAAPVAWRWNDKLEVVARCSNTTRDCHL